MTSHRLVALAIVLALVLVAEARAQTSPCLTQPDSVAKYRFTASLLFEGNDSTATVAAGKPWARFENIQVVTDSAVCAAGVAAFNDAAEATGTPREETAAYILALGGTGYAYIRPGDTTGEYQHVFIFTADWVFKATLVG